MFVKPVVYRVKPRNWPGKQWYVWHPSERDLGFDTWADAFNAAHSIALAELERYNVPLWEDKDSGATSSDVLPRLRFMW